MLFSGVVPVRGQERREPPRALRAADSRVRDTAPRLIKLDMPRDSRREVSAPFVNGRTAMAEACFWAAAAAAVSAERLPSGRSCPIRWLSERKPARPLRHPPHQGSKPASMNWKLYAPAASWTWHWPARRQGSRSSASPAMRSTRSHTEHGRYGNKPSWIARPAPRVAQIEMAGETAVDRVVFLPNPQASTATGLGGPFRGRLSLDGGRWLSVRPSRPLPRAWPRRAAGRPPRRQGRSTRPTPPGPSPRTR